MDKIFTPEKQVLRELDSRYGAHLEFGDAIEALNGLMADLLADEAEGSRRRDQWRDIQRGLYGLRDVVASHTRALALIAPLVLSED